jgi:prepilin-type N-terminal cleavage/methylation domain-containing protein
MQRNQQGFTLVEITAVLVLMAIISAYVIGRSVNTEQNPGGGHETVR